MTDPYTDTATCVARLRREYDKHRKLCLAVDFDDTCHPFHGTSHTHDLVFALLHEAQRREFWIVIFTASDPSRYDMMREYMLSRGIKVHAVNQNAIPLPYGNHGKIYYNHFLDDRAGLSSACDILGRLFADIASDEALQRR
jgi:hypothetical protein